jgi:hypothetical protein
MPTFPGHWNGRGGPIPEVIRDRRMPQLGGCQIAVHVSSVSIEERMRSFSDIAVAALRDQDTNEIVALYDRAPVTEQGIGPVAPDVWQRFVRRSQNLDERDLSCRSRWPTAGRAYPGARAQPHRLLRRHIRRRRLHLAPCAGEKNWCHTPICAYVGSRPTNRVERTIITIVIRKEPLRPIRSPTGSPAQ